MYMYMYMYMYDVLKIRAIWLAKISRNGNPRLQKKNRSPDRQNCIAPTTVGDLRLAQGSCNKDPHNNVLQQDYQRLHKSPIETLWDFICLAPSIGSMDTRYPIPITESAKLESVFFQAVHWSRGTVGPTVHAIMMETDRNELILAEILADSGSESDDYLTDDNYRQFIRREEIPAAFQEVRK